MRAGAAKVDLHAPHYPDDPLAMLAVEKLGVVDAGEAQVVGAAALQEFEIAGMVDDAGKIGVGEIDAHHEAVTERGERAGQPGRKPILFTILSHRAFLLPAELTVICRPPFPMSSMLRSIKNCLWALALVFAASAGGRRTFSMKRGLNLDIWTTWPEEDRWNEEDALLPFPEWRKSLKESDLIALKAAGFDFLRMPVDPSPFLSGQTEGFRDRLLASVVELARLVNKAGLKVVVDMHLFPAGEGRSIGMGEVMDDPEVFDRYVELVRTIAQALSQIEPCR